MAPGLAVAGHSLVDELAPQQTCIGPAHHGLGVEALYNSLAQTVGYFAIGRVGGQIDPFARVGFEVEELRIVAVYIVVLVLALRAMIQGMPTASCAWAKAMRSGGGLSTMPIRLSPSCGNEASVPAISQKVRP
jgi:hypothetical protein